MNPPNPGAIGRRTFIKRSAFTVGAITLLSQGKGLAQNPVSSGFTHKMVPTKLKLTFKKVNPGSAPADLTEQEKTALTKSLNDDGVVPNGPGTTLSDYINVPRNYKPKFTMSSYHTTAGVKNGVGWREWEIVFTISWSAP